MTTDQAQRLLNLQPYLTRIAGALARDRGADFDDLLNTMNLAILERAANDPTFLNQADNYIARLGGWAARDWARRERQWADLSPVSLDLEIEEAGNGTSQPMIELLVADDDADPADLAGLAELADALAELGKGLGDTTRRVLELLTIGYKGKEIAEALKITAPSVCYHKQQIRQAAAALAA